jgi:hypothetical protein
MRIALLCLLAAAAAHAARRLSTVVSIRNDNYGGNLLHRATLALQAQLEVADEVVLVDFNTLPPRPPFVKLLPPGVREHPRLKSVVIGPAACAAMRDGRECADRYMELRARQAAVDAASGDVIASTNIDVVPPARRVLDAMMDAVWSGINEAGGTGGTELAPFARHAFILPREEVVALASTARLAPPEPAGWAAAGSPRGRRLWSANVSLASLAEKVRRRKRTGPDAAAAVGGPEFVALGLGKVSIMPSCGDLLSTS